MKEKVVQKIVLGALVTNRGQVLLLQRHKNEKILPGLWELPSGKREEFEDPIIALKREVLEETGLQIKVIGIINLFSYVIKKANYTSDSVQINFLVEPANKIKVRLSSEHENFAWVDENKLKKYPVTKEVKKTLKIAWQIQKR